MATLFVLMFMGVFSLIMSALAGFAFEEAKYGQGIQAREQALSIAEAGIDYYKSYLGHNPSIMTAGAAPESPVTYTVKDPESGEEMGAAAITAAPYLQCGQTQWVDVSSKGTADADPSYPRTISVRYMAPSVADYAFLLNTNAWFGSANVSNGPYFSNGGIREDGTNNSTVTSAQSTFTCDDSLGCDPSQTKPGVFGSGPDSRLWSYPVSQINFAGMVTDFSTIKTFAQTSGLYLSGTATYVNGIQQGSTYSSVAGTDSKGYHLVFNSNGTVTVYLVTGTDSIAAFDQERGAMPCSLFGIKNHQSQCIDDYDHPDITSQTLLGTYTPPAACSLIYVNAKTWIEGTISGRVTVVAADTGSYAPDIILANNINYATQDGTTGLTAIAEDSVLYPLKAPNTMSVRGIFVAENGYVGIAEYFDGYTGGNDSYVLRNSLTVEGTIVSYLQPGVYWPGSPSGFQNRTNTYDRILAFNPPPFTPAVPSSYGYELWQER